MTTNIPALLDKLRRMEQIASQVETGAGRLFQLDHAATLREAIAALERPLATDDGPYANKVHYTNDEITSLLRGRDEFIVARGLWSEFTDSLPRPMTGFIATLTPEQKEAALAYRGPEGHGPSEPIRHADDGAEWIDVAELAAEDAREKEATERDDDMGAAHCVKYYQQRELD